MGTFPKVGFLCICIYIIGATADDTTTTKPTTTKLTISTIKSPPFMMERGDKLEGFMNDFTEELCNRLHGDCTLRLVKDGEYGRFNSTGNKWTGMIGEVLDQKCDMAIADLTITAERIKAVDFSRPILMSRLTVVHKIRKGDMDNMNMKMMGGGGFFTILKPMSPLVWISFLVLIFMHVGLITLVEMKMMIKKDEKELLTNKCPRSKAGRFMSTMFLVWLVMFVAIYISSLTSQRMNRIDRNIETRKGLTFSTLEELVNDPHMRYGFVGTGSTARFLKNAKNPLYNRIHQQVKDWQTTTTNAMEGILKVMGDPKANFAFIMEANTAEFLIRKHCDLYMVPKPFGPNKGFCVAMRKNTDLMTKIDIEILTMKEEGLIESLFNKWWRFDTPCRNNNLHRVILENTNRRTTNSGRNMMEDCTECHQVTMKDMGVMYIFIICGMIIGILLAVFDNRRNRG